MVAVKGEEGEKERKRVKKRSLFSSFFIKKRKILVKTLVKRENVCYNSAKYFENAARYD